MSLLGSQVYANADQAIWLPAAGGVITGNLTVEKDVYAKDFITQGGGFNAQTAVGVPKMFMGNVLGQSFIQSDDPLYFTRLGGIAQTSMTLTVAPALDNFTTGVVTAQRLELNSPNTCGRNTIAVGQTNAVIPSTSVTASSIILVTHSGAAAAGPGNGAAQGGLTCNPALIVPGVSFRVDLVDPATGIAVAASVVGVDFNYLVIN